jgi:hypothetical protein
MTSEATRAIIDHLSDRTDEQSTEPHKKIGDRLGGYPEWLEPFFARVAAPVGDVMRIEYSTAVVSLSEDWFAVTGSVVVITDTAVISGRFKADRDRMYPEGTVRAWPRSTIERVSIDEIRSSDEESDPERAEDAAVVTLALPGATRIVMPPATAPHELPVWDSRLLAFLPQLLRS